MLNPHQLRHQPARRRGHISCSSLNLPVDPRTPTAYRFKGLVAAQHTLHHACTAGKDPCPTLWSFSAYPRRLVAAQRALRHVSAAALIEVHRAAVLRTQKALLPYSGKARTLTPLSHTPSATAYLRRLVAAQRALRHARAAARPEEHRAAPLRT